MKNFFVFGLGQFGSSLAIELANNGHDVTAIDINRDAVEKIKDQVTRALVADARNKQTLSQLDLDSERSIAIIAIGEDFESSLLITVQLHKLGMQNIYARVINDSQEHLLDLIQVKGKIKAETLASEQLARQLDNSAFLRHISIDKTHAIAELRLPESWVDKSLAQVHLRAQHRLNLLTIRRCRDSQTLEMLDEEQVIDFPSPGMKFISDDVLIVFGVEADLKKFTNNPMFD